MDGILNINKPRGITSFGVVALIRRITGERRVGHAGTLDPEATGVLPVCLGQATRVIQFMFAEKKTYCAEVELGVTTDTCDATGKITSARDPSGITRVMVDTALAGFRGSINQIPPLFSAVKQRGKPLYELARAGIQVERKGRLVHIYKLEIVNWLPPVVTLMVVCGKGTYIRSLAHDLGEALGCGAHMKSLIRLRVGPFGIEEALTASGVEEINLRGELRSYLYPPDYVLTDFPALVVELEQQRALVHGMPIILEKEIKASGGTGSSLQDTFRVYNEDGCFVGMVKYDPENNRWRPVKVFIKSTASSKG